MSTWTQDPLFPLWYEGALVHLRADPVDHTWCCWGRVVGVRGRHAVVDWSTRRRGATHPLPPGTVHETRLESVRW